MICLRLRLWRRWGVSGMESEMGFVGSCFVLVLVQVLDVAQFRNFKCKVVSHAFGGLHNYFGDGDRGWSYAAPEQERSPKYIVIQTSRKNHSSSISSLNSTALNFFKMSDWKRILAH
jgi:hypothetical protein